MNKQEFQQTIKNMKPPKFFTAITLNDAYEAGFEEAKGNALCNSCFLNEPEKPVVPKFVADMIAERKNQKYGIVETIQNLNVFNNPFNYIIENQFKWVIENQEDFVKAWLYGYEIEKEKLYTVEIPDPNGLREHALVKDIKGDIFIGHKCSNDWREVSDYQLTESEIKQDFDWAWQFAKEVEDD
ncbi:hypothetical protein Si046_01218 [Streptococcus infantarius subsp. infantarius]|nr:hypothetical protein [Streptococcus infantarius subsp. infantarius]